MVLLPGLAAKMRMSSYRWSLLLVDEFFENVVHHRWNVVGLFMRPKNMTRGSKRTHRQGSSDHLYGRHPHLGGQTREQHHGIVVRVLDILHKHRLYLKVEMCTFEQPMVEYLSLILSEGHMEMDPVKVAGVRDWPTPRNVTEVQSFVGFVNFYRCFVQDFSHVAKPLHQLTKKAKSGDGPTRSKHL